MHNTKYSLIALIGASCFILSACTSTTIAPISSIFGEGSNHADTLASSHGDYIVQSGDTLYSLAKRSHTTVQELMRINNLSSTSLSRGQHLYLNSHSHLTTASKSTHTTSPVAENAPVTESVSTYTPRAEDASELAWTWPTQGKIISSFNTNTNGIDIQAPLGTPVYAAADGAVIYVGNGIRGLGNLLLIQHAKGFITAYAHNARILVKTKQLVRRGQQVATVGQTDANSPRLHFEVRRNRKPVNPLSYLPKR